MGNRSMNWNSKSRLHCKHCRHCWLTLRQPTFDTHRRTKSCSTLEVECPSVQHLAGAINAFPLLVLRGREEEVNSPCVVLVLVAWVAVQEGVRHICIPHRFEVSPSCYGAIFLYVVKKTKLGGTCTWVNRQSDRRDHHH